jgi:hypothetical protein
MFVVWRGYGIWFLLVPCATLGAAAYMAEHWKGILDTRYLIGFALAVAGIICFVGGLIVNCGGPFQVIDRLTGLLVTIKCRHSLYGIPVHYWGLVFVVAAGAMALLGAFGTARG